MDICNFCSNKKNPLKSLSDVINMDNQQNIYIEDLLKIFSKDLLDLFSLNNSYYFICRECLVSLENSYKFVEQIKEANHRLRQEICIKTQPVSDDNADKHIFKEKEPQHSNKLENKLNETSKHIESSFKFKTILPKEHYIPKPFEKEIPKSVSFVSRLYKCLECTSTFKSFKLLRQHEAEYCNNFRINGLYVCKYCHLCFRGEPSLKEHQHQLHPTQQFICCLCNDKDFSSRGYLQRHISKIHDHEYLKYFCGECKELIVLITPESVRAHFRELHTLETNGNEGPNAFDDDVEDDMDLEMHEEFLDEFLLAHTNENSFQFSGCWEALDLHLPDMLQNHNNEDFSQAFPCPKCFEQFKNPQPLLKHLAEFHNLPVLICRTCHKAFSSFKEFRQHKMEKCLKRHPSNEEVLAIPCPYCKKEFKTSISLKQHIRIVHTHCKKHICQLCDKQFSTLDHLKKHVLSQHQNERKHLCHICTKAFTRQCHLKQHMFIHTTGKTLKCSECLKMFWRKVDLHRHREKHHSTA